MTVKRHLCGYDLRTEFLGVDHEFRPEFLPVVRDLLPGSADDPEFVDPLEVTDTEARRLGEVPGVPIDLDRFVYCVESDEDYRFVAAQVQAMRAKA